MRSADRGSPLGVVIQSAVAAPDHPPVIRPHPPPENRHPQAIHPEMETKGGAWCGSWGFGPLIRAGLRADDPHPSVAHGDFARVA